MLLPTVIANFMQRLHRPVYEARLAALVDAIIVHIQPGDRVIDVGCGFGALGQAIMSDPRCPADVEMRGLECVRRVTELMPIDAYNGGTMPYDDGAFDVVIVADVLHHENRPHVLLAECCRVASRQLIIKDHKVDGFLAWLRISLSDWAANAPYQVECLFRYNTLAQWHRWLDRHRLTLAEEHRSMRLYPPVVNWIFGRRLQYFAVADVADVAAEDG